MATGGHSWFLFGRIAFQAASALTKAFPCSARLGDQLACGLDLCGGRGVFFRGLFQYCCPLDGLNLRPKSLSELWRPDSLFRFKICSLWPWRIGEFVKNTNVQDLTLDLPTLAVGVGL